MGCWVVLHKEALFYLGACWLCKWNSQVFLVCVVFLPGKEKQQQQQQQKRKFPSSETQGQIVGARGSLNGRENVARRKLKNVEKSPWGQCLTKPVPNGRRRSGFWWVPENFCVFLPNQKAERRRPFGTGLVRHCPQGLFSPFFTFLRAIFIRPFRFSLAPTISPWVSEDGKFHGTTTGFSAKWRLRNEHKNSTLMTWLKPISYAAITNQKQSDLGSDASSVWNFCVRSSEIVSQGNQWWRHEISAVLSGCVDFSTFAVLATFLVFFFSFWFLFYHKHSLREDSV